MDLFRDQHYYICICLDTNLRMGILEYLYSKSYRGTWCYWSDIIDILLLGDL